MNEINPSLIAEIRILLIADESEFQIERAIINDLISPNLRTYFSHEFDIDFNIIDVYEIGGCSNLPAVDKSNFLISQINKCHSISNGLSALFLIGDNYGELQAPKSLTDHQFTHVLHYLQSNNDPSWIIFNAKYTKNDKTNEYLLDENIGSEEDQSILSAIQSACSTDSDGFPQSFKELHYTSTLEKCVKLSTSTAATIASTKVIHRSINYSRQSKESKIQADTISNQNIKAKYESLIKLLTSKFVNENYIKYSVGHTTLCDCHNELIKNPDKLSEIFKKCKFNPNKRRLLAKDLRVNSSYNLYLQIFTENVLTLIRESSAHIFLEKQFPQSIQICEILTQKIPKIKFSNPELVTSIDRNRERELTIVNNYIGSTTAKMPGLIFGSVGSGKSILLSKIFERVENSSNAILVIRRCGKTISSSSLQLLLSSITQQIHTTISKTAKASQSCEYAVCVYEFWNSLNRATENKPIIILLDDVDKLYPSSHTQMVKWLPHSLPMGVKILLTSSSDAFYHGFKKRYDVTNIINLPMMDSRETIKLFNASLESKDISSIPDSILSQANYVLQENSSPLFFSLLSLSVDVFTDPESLSTDIVSLIKMYLKKLEQSCSPILVQHILSYLSLSRFGLSLSNIVDILSLDNRILEFVQFDFESGKIFQFPTFIVEQLLKSCENLLEYVQTNKRLLIRLRHQIFITAIVEHYQLLQDDGKYYLRNLSDYWTSKYEADQGKSISCNIPERNESVQVDVKRNVVAQPYYTINKSRKPCVNERKLTELPSLLIAFNRPQELYKMIIFNFEYLFATLSHFGINQLMSEIYMCRQIMEIKNNDEVELLLVQLRLLSAEVISDARLLAPDLTGRLSHLIGTNPLLAHLLLHIDSMAPKINTIVSLIPSYPTIDMENIHVDIDSSKEIILSALSYDNQYVATIHLVKPTEELLITIWDSQSVTKSQLINIDSIPNSKFILAIYIPQRDDLLIIQFENPKSKGFLFVNIELSSIVNSVKFSNKSSIKIEFLSKNHLYLLVNNEMQIFSVQTGKKDQTISKLPWPTILTPNDKYLIGQKPPQIRKQNSEAAITFNLRILNGGSGEIISQLVLQDNAAYLLANGRNEILFVSTKFHGIIYKYDIGQIVKKDVKKLKSSYQLKLTEQPVNGQIQKLLEKYSSNIRANKLQLSTDEKHLLVEYCISDSFRLVAVWNVTNKSLVFCNHLSNAATVSFSSDGHHYYSFIKKESLTIINLQNGVSHNIELNESPNEVYMLKSERLFLTFPNAIKMMSLKVLLEKHQSSKDKIEFHPETFQISLPKPKVSEEKVIVFSNELNNSKFSYFSLMTNSISVLDITHCNESLSEFPSDRFFSPDGTKLVLVYGFKLAEMMKAHKSAKQIDELMLPLNENGFIISNRNHYRKPEIPGENYFTGQTPISDQIGDDSSNAYSQKIVKVIDLNNSRTIFQVSLTGEKILGLSDKILLTLKPDYANIVGNCEDSYDIVSIYHITEGRFVSSIYLEHPIIDFILIPPTRDKLLVCCGNNGRLIKLLGGEHFSTTLLNIDMQSLLKYFDEFDRSSVITKLFIFQNDMDSILIQYCWLDPNSNTVKLEKDTHYTKVDLVNKEILCQFSSMGKVVDVSHDGLMAVDSLLNLYDLSKGNIIKKLQSSIGWSGDVNMCHFRSLFSHDSSYIVALDVYKGVIWVIMTSDQRLSVGRALLTSSISINDNRSNGLFQMCLGFQGHLVIVFNDLEFKLFAIKMECEPIMSEIVYKSNIDRIKRLLNPV